MLEIFAREARERQAAVVMVLHEPVLAARFCDRALLMYGDGCVDTGGIAEMLTAERLSALFEYPLARTECGGYTGCDPPGLRVWEENLLNCPGIGCQSS